MESRSNLTGISPDLIGLPHKINFSLFHMTAKIFVSSTMSPFPLLSVMWQASLRTNKKSHSKLSRLESKLASPVQIFQFIYCGHSHSV